MTARLKPKLARKALLLQDHDYPPVRPGPGETGDAPARSASPEDRAAAAGLAQVRFFRRRNLQLTLGLFAVALVYWGASALTQFNLLDGIVAVPVLLEWLGKNLVFTADTWDLVPKIVTKLMETAGMSVAATVIAAVFALVLAILGSKSTRPHPLLSGFCRLIASVFRNVPVVAWAIILMFSFGQGMLTGFLAILIETFGFLVRSFMETIDETSSSSVEALKSAGATWSHVVVQAVLPQSLPQMVSWMLYMVESNIRSATLVGLLTGSGIGFLFDLYYKTMDYGAASLVVLAIVIVILALELLSNYIRRIIL